MAEHSLMSNSEYDATEKMVFVPLASPGYHTKITSGFVHPTRESIYYAADLFEVIDVEPGAQVRAEDILRRVIALQDQDPLSKTYGIWSWYLEEPLAEMNPPDWNWADFLSHPMLDIVRRHSDRLSADVAGLLRESILHATRSIKRRDVVLGYTNIAAKGTFSTLAAGELYGDDELFEYGLERLSKFHKYIIERGSFDEYNSPTYTLVTMLALWRIASQVQNAEAKHLGAELHKMAWQELASHFHAPTRQWAGPHSRCYSTLLSETTLLLIHRGTLGAANLGIEDEGLEPRAKREGIPQCPDDLISLFTVLSEPRSIVKTLVRGELDIIGTTYLHPKFALSNASVDNFWNQRRALLAYWGDADKPAYLHVRVLRDGYDLAAAQSFTVQKENRLVSLIMLTTDGGYTHPYFDLIQDGIFEASAFRVRFELGGDAKNLKLHLPASVDSLVEVADREIKLQFQIPFANCAGIAPIWEQGSDDKSTFLDLVFWKNEQKSIDLKTAGEIGIGLALAISTSSDEPKINATASVDGQILTVRHARLEVSGSLTPGPIVRRA